MRWERNDTERLTLCPRSDTLVARLKMLLSLLFAALVAGRPRWASGVACDCVSSDIWGVVSGTSFVVVVCSDSGTWRLPNRPNTDEPTEAEMEGILRSLAGRAG